MAMSHELEATGLGFEFERIDGKGRRGVVEKMVDSRLSAGVQNESKVDSGDDDQDFLEIQGSINPKKKCEKWTYQAICIKAFSDSNLPSPVPQYLGQDFFHGFFEFLLGLLILLVEPSLSKLLLLLLKRTAFIRNLLPCSSFKLQETVLGEFFKSHIYKHSGYHDEFVGVRGRHQQFTWIDLDKRRKKDLQSHIGGVLLTIMSTVQVTQSVRPVAGQAVAEGFSVYLSLKKPLVCVRVPASSANLRTRSGTMNHETLGGLVHATLPIRGDGEGVGDYDEKDGEEKELNYTVPDYSNNLVVTFNF
ncbi:hypothetical protein K435DRAFT_794370 [Dendrothele bispora CBS 962.96]|uniref:Uncharacterized protein n=1 Tax=Dendrothele bispora (strain CBS 962.96) TaxID=1314807 RepID=A0A4S8MC96_DENBC|nr:hypothetical protein K435DRAFT_794370 [Dendrothele bispora CBS 962.96]